MKRLLLFSLAFAPATAEAFINGTTGANCATCHSSPAPRFNAIDFLEEGTLSVNGQTRPAVFAYPGETVELSARIRLNNHNRYALSISDLDAPSQPGANSTKLKFTPDSNWSQQVRTDGPSFYQLPTIGSDALTWSAGSGSINYNFSAELKPNTPVATYALEYFVAGTRVLGDGPLFAERDLFYLQVLPLPDGDFNDDGNVDFLDYTLWRDSLGQSGDNLAADATGDQGFPDGTVDSLDYQLWAAQMQSASASITYASIPEPLAIELLVCALLAFWFTLQLRITLRTHEFALVVGSVSTVTPPKDFRRR